MLVTDLLKKPETISVQKNTNNDKRSILYQAFEQQFSTEEAGWLYVTDHDDEFVYIEVYNYETRGTWYWKIAYTFNGTSATFGNEATEVVNLSQWEDVVSIGETSIEKSLLSILKNHFGGSEKEQLQVIKSLNEEEMIAVEPLYIKAGDVDGVGDTIDQEGVECLVKSVNDKIASGELKSNYFHKVWTEDFHFTKAWINPYDCMIGETLVPEGQPIVEVQYVNKAAWEQRKEGNLMGLSIEGSCEYEDL